MSTVNEYKQFSMPEDLYQEGSPILIHKAELVRVEGEDHQIFRMEIENLGDKAIRNIKIELLLVDIHGNLLNKINVKYGKSLEPKAATGKWEIGDLDLNIDAILLGQGAVVFEDHSYWYGHLDTFSPVPKPEVIPEHQIDAKRYRENTANENIYVPWQWHGIWRCSCGAMNVGEECRKCHLDKKTIWHHYRKSSRSFCPECHEPLLTLTFGHSHFFRRNKIRVPGLSSEIRGPMYYTIMNLYSK